MDQWDGPRTRRCRKLRDFSIAQRAGYGCDRDGAQRAGRSRRWEYGWEREYGRKREYGWEWERSWEREHGCRSA